MTNCLVTNLPVENFKKCVDTTHNHKPYYSYTIKVNNQDLTLGFCLSESCYNETTSFIESNRNKLTSLLLNGHEIKFENEELRANNFDHIPILIHKYDLQKYLRDYYTIKTPTEKLENLFLEIAKFSSYDGELINLSDKLNDELFISKLYFTNAEELKFYLGNLENELLIEIKKDNKLDDFESCKITLNGLHRLINITEEGNNSTNCFIAMSFDKEDEIIFDEAIFPACEKYKFNAIRVDRLHPENEQTINDLIIAEIKKSKFIIADFTKQKNGVYFEAGYALGKGKKVIYTCSEAHFKTLHFDINHFPVLIYKNNQELKQMLINKIEAFILD